MVITTNTKTPSMNVYTVIDKASHRKIKLDDFNKKQLNLLVQAHDGEYDKLHNFSNTRILIDSGAYADNFTETEVNQEKLEKRIKNYIDFVKRTKDDPRIQGYFDMDLIYLGLPAVRELRDYLLTITPRIIAVYHPVWGLPEFKIMCRKYKYISVCGNDGITFEGYQKMVNYAHKCGCYIHGLGINDDRLLKKTPFNSVDSATWLTNAVRAYYFGSNIEKNTENNRIYRPMFERKFFLKQLQRQQFYNDYWRTYFTLQNKRL